MKTLTITNGKQFIDIECNKIIHTRVSEECMRQLSYKDKIDPEVVILSVLLDQAKVDENDRHNWSLIH